MMRNINLYFLTLMFFTCVISNSIAQNPGGVSGSSLWIKADAGTNTTTNAAAVSSWANQISGGIGPMTQATAGSQPVYNSSWRNFNPAIVLTNDYLFANGTSPWTNTTDGYSQFVVYETTTTSAGGFNLFGNHTANGGVNGAVVYTIVPTQASPQHPASTSALNHPHDVNTPYVQESSYTGAGTGTGTSNGTASAPLTPGSVTGATGFGIGGSRNATFLAPNSTVSEVIIYPVSITSNTDKQKIQSYLATKYGITLSHNYLNSVGAAIYNIATYGNDIAGIGKDDNTMLNQKQSKSVNSDALVTIGAGNIIAATNAANTASIPNNSYMMWGNNDGAISWTLTESPNPISRQKLEREWRVDETGINIGSVKIQVPDDSSPLSTKLPAEGTDVVYLLYDADGDFSTGSIQVPMTLVGTNWEVNYDFPADGFFTFAKTYTPPPAPAGVAGQLLWVKADAETNTTTEGASVTSWGDFGSSPESLVQGATTTPVYDQVWRNFNPGIHFTNDYLYNNTLSPWSTGSDGYSQFIAYDYISNGQIAGSNNTAAGSDGYGFFGNATSTGQYNQTTPTAGAIVVNHTPLTSNTPYIQESSTPGATITSAVTGNGTSNGTASTGSAGTSLDATATGIGLGGFRGGPTGNPTVKVPDATIGEFIVFPTQVSNTDKMKINTYLAIKYGVTLASDYISPSGVTLWDVGASGGFDNDITGIGNDNNCLNQKQSKSENVDDILTISKGNVAASNAASTGVLKPGTFLLWGNNNGSTTTTSVISPPGITRINRTWQFQETGETGLVKVSIPSSTFTCNTPNKPYMIISTDATINGADQYIPMTLNGSNYELDVNAVDNSYFTFGCGATITVNLSLDKSTPTTAAGQGDPVTITTTVTNAGPTSATDVKINDAIPTGMTFVSATPSVGTYYPETGIWHIPVLAPGSATLTMNLIAQ